MKPSIDFRECLKDSPTFRASLEDAEQDLDQLELKLEKLIKLCNGMLDAGKTFCTANNAYVAGLKDVAAHFSTDQLSTEALGRFTQVLTELQKYQNILMDQAHRSIVKGLTNFIKTDVRNVKETRRHFEKMSTDMDNALVRNAQAARNKTQECDDSHNYLTAMTSGFYHTALDYVFQMNVLHSKKKFDVLATVLAYMSAQSTFFHQGSDLFADLDQYMKQVASQLEVMNAKAAVEQREMENRHSLVQQKLRTRDGRSRLLDLSAPLDDVPSGDQINRVSDARMEGYLFKRTSNTFKTWVRRWFAIINNQLVYRKRSKDSLTIMEDDLRLCTVKPSYDIDRRFCFEVLSPSRSHTLQADSEAQCQAWIHAIQAGVSKAYGSRPSMDMNSCGDVQLQEGASSSQDNEQVIAGGGASATLNSRRLSKKSDSPMSGQSRVKVLRSIPGNDHCADCGTVDPSWSSINIGITLCIECSGIHRSLGVHISKVRSITLDSWEPELLRVMAELGNSRVNQIYEANVSDASKRPSHNSPRPVREAWIKAKYVEKAFVRLTTHKVDSSASNVGQVSASPCRQWSVYKRRRKPRPVQTMTTAQSDISLSSRDELTTTDSKGLNVKDVKDDVDSGLDVIVFGADINSDDSSARRILPLVDNSSDSSEPESISEAEVDAEVRSTTSVEDISSLTSNMLLYKAARARNVFVMMDALAQSAQINWMNEDDYGRTPLIQGIHSGSMTTVEFLLLNGAKVDIRDKNGQGPLHHATMLGNTGHVCQLLKRGANQHSVDEKGQDPLSIAMTNANADIVTLLRLAKLNEEMKEADYGMQDDTVSEVFRDFTNMANSTPERLHRNK